MFTAKSLQLLDANNNNISPATNIETIYYEYQQGGLVKRNHIFKHFPVYVNYAYGHYSIMDFYSDEGNHQSYLFDDYYANKSSILLDDIDAYNKSIIGHKNKTYVDPWGETGYKHTAGNVDENGEFIDPTDSSVTPAQISNEHNDLYDTNILLTKYRDLDGNLREDPERIYVSAVTLRKFKNTDFRMLDISTYDLTEILSRYATNNWVHLSHETLNTKIDNATIYHADANGVDIKVLRNVGSLNAGTSITTLDGTRYDEILDRIFSVGYSPEFKPMVIEAYIPQVYYMKPQDLQWLPDDVSMGYSYQKRVAYVDITLKIKYPGVWSFDWIADPGFKREKPIQLPKDTLGTKWTWSAPHLTNNDVLYFVKDRENDSARVRNKIVLRKFKTNIVPDLKKPVLPLMWDEAKPDEDILTFNLVSGMDKILNDQDLVDKVRKTNNDPCFENIAAARAYFGLDENDDNCNPILTAMTYTLMPGADPILLTSKTYTYSTAKKTADAMIFPFPMIGQEVIPAYPIYHGYTMQAKAMKCNWVYGNKVHKIITLMQTNKAFYIGIPKIVVNQMVDPIPKLYRMLQQSKWTTTNDWTLEAIYPNSNTSDENSVCVFFKVSTKGVGKVRDIMFTVNFGRNNLK